MIFRRAFHVASLMVGLLALGGTAHASCSSPAGEAGDIAWASNISRMVYCDGTNWVTLGSSGGGAGFLNELSDVDTSGAATGSILAYNGSSWVISSTGNSTALGDRITSGTVSVTVNTDGYISLTTGVTDWGYLSSANSYLPRLSTVSVSGTYLQLTSPSANITCNNGISGTLRYASGTMQVCDGANWGSIAGAAALASLTDVAITNVAGRDYLRYDAGTSRWVNVSESTVMSTTTMMNGWPDAIQCYGATGSVWLKLSYGTTANVVYLSGFTATAASENLRVSFNGTGTWTSVGSTGVWTGFYESNCNSAATTISSLYASGRAFNFIGNSGAGGGGALGDRITSGTLPHAVTVNSATGVISLSTGGTTWGYFANGGSFLPRLSTVSVSGTYLQLTSPSANITCNNGISGTLRYASGTMQVCNGTAWGSIAGAAALASLTDVAITNVAGRDYLRYDASAQKWVNISESTVMSTTTMVPNWPDAIICNVTSDGIGKAVFYRTYSTLYSGSPNYRAIATTPIDIYFNNDGSYRSHLNAATTDCMVSIDTLYAQGQAFNFIGNSGASDGNALGDRITSGTLAMVANSTTSYVSLSTNGTDWGYLSSGNTYLPNLRSNSISSTLVSATNISGTLIQVGGGNGAACDASRKGAIRYSDTSNTVQVCAGASGWKSLVSGTAASALSGLSDVSITNIAGRDYLRYDSVSGKWVNISESTVMSTTTILPGFPDAIMCANATNTYVLPLTQPANSNGKTYYQYSTIWIGYNTTTQAYDSQSGLTGYDCVTNTWSISQLYAQGKAFNFIGTAASSGSALGDRITSGTLAMVANSETSYVSLSTAGTTWGYLSSLFSYLPNISTQTVSATGVLVKGVYAAKGLFTKDDAESVAFIKTGNGTVSVKAGTVVEVNNTLINFESATPVSMPTLNAGTDYAIYACGDGTAVADGNLSSTSNCTGGSRKIGGFHYAPGGNATGTSGGDTTPQINEYSFWDVKWRPACKDPRGMTLVNDSFWVDIYLTGVDHHVNGTSKYNVTIADSSSPPKVPAMFGGNGTTTYATFMWYEANEVMQSHGKELLSQGEFAAMAQGTTEASSGGTDPVSTILREAYTSKYGVMLATGNMYVWSRDFSTRVDGDTTTWAWKTIPGGKGNAYTQGTYGLVAARLGGYWGHAANSGSRASDWLHYPWSSASVIGARGRCDHVRLE